MWEKIGSCLKGSREQLTLRLQGNGIDNPAG